MANEALAATSTARNLTLDIATWSAADQIRTQEPEALAFGRHCLLDFLGTALAGASEFGVQMLMAELTEDTILAQGAPGATLIGQQTRRGVLDAALVNGTAAHALDFDDVHFDMPGHPTVAIMPAVVALAEREGATLDAALDAYITGVEAACAVGRFMTHSHYSRGWHATGTVGAIGAAVASARLLKLDAASTARAMGLAISQCGGLKSMFATMCKPMHAGRAAHTGLLAARLAARGFTAREDMLECAQGFAAVFDGASDTEAALVGLGAPHAIAGVLFKYHAACYGTHAGIDAMLMLREQHDFDADAVAKVELTVPAENLQICDIKQPSTGLEAKFSMTHTAAMALCGIATGDTENYSEAVCEAPNVVRLRDRIRVEADPSEFRAVASATVHLNDGVALHTHADVSVAETDLERQARRLREKFMLLARPILGANAALVADVVLDGAPTMAVASIFENF
jgi:2-methylcitrate dehydratase PrpD